jgi:hypothetical protein
VNSDQYAYDLPIRFDYENDYGIRKVKEVKTFRM